MEQFGWELIEEKHICAYSQEGAKSSCHTDAGGPLSTTSDGDEFYTAIGITSFETDDCNNADYPTVYTRLSSYLDWITTAKAQLSSRLPNSRI